LRERGAEIRIGCAPVASVPARIYRDLHQIRESSDLLRPGRGAARQCETDRNSRVPDP
jgi:hypothetical protein